MSEETDKEWLARLDALANPMSRGEARDRGALQGVTAGFGDELAAGIDTVASKIPLVRELAQKAHDPRFPPITDPNVSYDQRRDAYRAVNQTAAEAFPADYKKNVAGGAVAGSMLPTSGFARGVGSGIAARLGASGALAQGAALGGASAGLMGAGFSDAPTAAGVAADAARAVPLGAAAGALGAGLNASAESAAAKSAVNLRRDIAGPQIGGEAGAKAARQRIYELGDQVNEQVKETPGLGDAIKAKNTRITESLAKERSLKLSDENTAHYANAVARSKEGGFPMSAATDPLDRLAASLRKRGLSAQAAEVDKINTGNIRTDMFGQGTVADPRDVRAFISDLQSPRNSGGNLTLPEKDALAAKGEVASTLLKSLDDWVSKSAGPDVAAKIRANNKAISTLKTIQDAAVEGGKVQEMGTPRQQPTGVSGMAREALSGAARPAQDFFATPVGQGMLKAAAGATKAMPAPLIDAMVNKDRAAAQKAIADDIFGGQP